MSTFRKLIATKLSPDFRSATRIVDTPLTRPDPGQVRIKMVYAGINASDINYTSGFYTPGVVPPLDTGFEGIGRVSAIGDDVKGFNRGDPVAVTSYGAFSEYMYVPAKVLVPVPSPAPTILPLMVSGLTASIALEQAGEMKSGQTVLITAAAGGTGQFAVQLAKKAGNHVIGTCSSDEKMEFLRSLGCDRAINYKKENLMSVLKTEYPSGMDIVYECVGGEMYDTCVSNLAVKGKLIVIGMISGYQDQSAWAAKEKKAKSIESKLLSKSASIRGFFLNHYMREWGPHLQRLTRMVAAGDLIPGVDPTPFVGLEEVSDAIDHMYAGRNKGKVVVKISEDDGEKYAPASRL